MFGIDRVLRSLRADGERVPSCKCAGETLEGGAGGELDVVVLPFLKITGGRKECTLMRERRTFWVGNGGGG